VGTKNVPTLRRRRNKHRNYYYAVQHVRGFPEETFLVFVASHILKRSNTLMSISENCIKINHSAPFARKHPSPHDQSTEHTHAECTALPVRTDLTKGYSQPFPWLKILFVYPVYFLCVKYFAHFAVPGGSLFLHTTT